MSQKSSYFVQDCKGVNSPQNIRSILYETDENKLVQSTSLNSIGLGIDHSSDKKPEITRYNQARDQRLME